MTILSTHMSAQAHVHVVVAYDLVTENKLYH